MEDLRKKVDSQGEKIEKLEDNNFAVELYKEIIRLNNENAENQKRTLEIREKANNKMYKALFICIILIFVLIGFIGSLIGICLAKDEKYNSFREQAITKTELIQEMKDLHVGN